MQDLQNCEICGAPATHFCRGCGKWLCDKMSCNTRAAAAAVVKNPVEAIKRAPDAIAHAGDVLGNMLSDRLNPFK
jgi:hypothetical protein